MNDFKVYNTLYYTYLINVQNLIEVCSVNKSMGYRAPICIIILKSYIWSE